MKISTSARRSWHSPKTIRSPGFRKTPMRRARSSSCSIGTDDGIEGIGVTFYGGALDRHLAGARSTNWAR